MSKKARSVLFKIITVLILVGIAAVMMVIGRGHTVYFDNKSIDVNGETIKAAYKVVVYVNGEKVAKLANRERGMATWIGQDFSMDLEITQEKKGEERNESYAIKLPYDLDGIVINLTGLLNGLPQEEYMSEFVSAIVEEEEVEEIVTDEFAMSEDF